jgi:hypothetical protein
VAEHAQVLEARPHAALVVEDDLAGCAHAGQRVADGDGRDLPGDRLPAAAGRADRHDDEPIDPMIEQAPRELELARRLAVGIGDECAARRSVQLALDRADELLVPEVGEAADEQADDRGGPAGQGPGDRIGLVAEFLGRLADAPLGLGRHLHAAQRVADCGGREAGVLGQLANRGAAPGAAGHGPSVLGLDKRRWGGHSSEAVH